MMSLPPFPVDEATLGLLEAAINPRQHGDPDAESSNVEALMDFLSAMGGSDISAVEEEADGYVVMRDPHYHVNSAMLALIAEIRRLRGLVKDALVTVQQGQYDGAHHKTWAVDQTVRVLTGCPVVTKTALSPQGKPYSYWALGESSEYQAWVATYCQDGEYSWDVGIPP